MVCPDRLCASVAPLTTLVLLSCADSEALTLPVVSERLCSLSDVILIALARFIPSCLAFSTSLASFHITPPTKAIPAIAATQGFASSGRSATIPCIPNTKGIIDCANSPTLPPANDAAMVRPLIAPTPKLAFELNCFIVSLDVLLALVFSSTDVINLDSAAILRFACFKLIFSVAAITWARDSCADCDASPTFCPAGIPSSAPAILIFPRPGINADLPARTAPVVFLLRTVSPLATAICLLSEVPPPTTPTFEDFATPV